MLYVSRIDSRTLFGCGPRLYPDEAAHPMALEQAPWSYAATRLVTILEPKTAPCTHPCPKGGTQTLEINLHNFAGMQRFTGGHVT